jgi:hypothetical protein
MREAALGFVQFFGWNSVFHALWYRHYAGSCFP